MSDTPAETSASPSARAESPEGWSLTRRIAFRFACAYALLFLFPSPLDSLPMGEELFGELAGTMWEPLVRWVGNHVLHLGGDIEPSVTSSSDTTFAYVRLLCVFVVAVLATAVWSLVDRRRRHHEKAYDALRIYVRYTLAASMISYGLYKVIKVQFPFPSPTQLLLTYGESSPMGLLWRFMGYSTGYNVFSGSVEVLGGVLLLFRRTTTLGALVVLGAMANVVMLNFCYDVPVKVNSTHLLLMAAFLTLPDLRRLLQVFVLNRPTEPAALGKPFARRWMERARLPAKLLFLGVALIGGGAQALQFALHDGDWAPRPPHFGAYEVETFVRDGDTLPPLLTDGTRWRAAAVDSHSVLMIIKMDSKRLGYMMKEDPEKKTFTHSGGLGTPEFVLSYAEPDPEHLVLEGPLDGASLNVRLRKINPASFLLVNRSFHWINEFSYNR